MSERQAGWIRPHPASPQLLALVPVDGPSLPPQAYEDPLPEGDPRRFPGLDRALPGPGWHELSRAESPTPVPLNVETLESVACDGYRRDKIVFDTEDTMSVPAYLLVPDVRRMPGPGAAVLACHGHGPGKSPGRRSRAHRDAQCRLRPSQLVRRGYPCSPRTCVVSVSGRTGTPRTITPATPTSSTRRWQVGTRWPRTSGTCAARLDLLEWSTRSSIPARPGMVGISYGGTVTLARRPRSSDRVAAVGRERLLLVVGREPQDAVEHVWLPDHVRNARPPRTRGPRRPRGAEARCWSSPAPTTCCSPLPAAAESVRRVRLVYAKQGGRRTASCTTSSRGATSGTAPWRFPSWTAGSVRFPPPGLIPLSPPRRPHRRRRGHLPRRVPPWRVAAPGRARPPPAPPCRRRSLPTAALPASSVLRLAAASVAEPLHDQLRPPPVPPLRPPACHCSPPADLEEVCGGRTTSA